MPQKKSKLPVLYGGPRTGSALVEAMYAIIESPILLHDLDYATEVLGPARELKRLNPLARVPTLLLPGGEVLTESGAIALHLAARPRGERLAPPPGSRDHAKFLRMLFLLTGEIYPCFTFGDDPAEWVRGAKPRAELRASVEKHHQELLRVLESWLAPKGPWALGRRMSAIDVYCAMMIDWRPRRAWFKRNCPRMLAIALRLRRTPQLKACFARQESLT